MAKLPKVDVVVVGSGGGAGPLMTELSRAGRKVVVLERGAYRRTETDFVKSLDTLRFSTRKELSPTEEDLPLTYRARSDQVAKRKRYIMSNTVGGGTVAWVGQAFRFQEDDFRVKSALAEVYGANKRLAYLKTDGAAIEDWPLRYADLEPYYDKAEYHIGVGGWPGNIDGKIRPVNPEEGNPYEAPRKRDYPFRPLRDNAVDLAFRHGAIKTGYKPFHSPSGVTTVPYLTPYGVQRSACTYCSFCAWHGCWNGSKSSTLVSLVPVAEKTGHFELRTGADVSRVLVEHGRATGVEYIDDDGQVQVQPADVVVVAAYTHQTVRILLNSGITGGGQVGKYFMTRSAPSVNSMFDDRYLNSYAGPSVQRQGIEELNGELAHAEKLRLAADQFFVRGGYICATSQSTPLSAYDAFPEDWPAWGQKYKDRVRRYLNRIVEFRVISEPLPYEDGFIDLDPDVKDLRGRPAARVTRRAKSNEMRMAKFHYRKIAEIMRAAGAAQTYGSDQVGAGPMMTHDTGGCRMGDDPHRSVTNRYGQLWDVPNVFVSGGALFPTMSGHNPTLTIWALSYWIGDALLHGKVDLTDARKHT